MWRLGIHDAWCVCVFWVTIPFKGVFRSRDINFDSLKLIFSCIPSRHDAKRFIPHVWNPPGVKSFSSISTLYKLNLSTYIYTCQSTEHSYSVSQNRHRSHPPTGYQFWQYRINFFMYPEPLRYRMAHSVYMKPVWVKIVQVYPYFIHFEN